MTDTRHHPDRWRRCAAVLSAAVSLFVCASARAEKTPAFRTRILPILTKAGCNSGACHGAATGQGGFKLSLLGYDPEEDHDHITREFGARRLDFESPGESLFLRKATGRTEHEGGRRIPRNSDSYKIVLNWIAAGAPYGPRELHVREITISPADTLLKSTNQSVHLRVTALLSDGSREDVTSLALYTSNDDAMAEVTRTGEVTTRGCGLTSIMVRYSGQVGAARVAVPFGMANAGSREFTPNNFIDEQIQRELKRLGLPSSPMSGQGEFLRRVHLDVTGRLPAFEEVRAFLNTPDSPAKRQRAIDELLQRGEFVDFWTMRLADLLLISGKSGDDSTRAYHDWLREQVARNAPFDQLVRSLLTASGNVSREGPANYFMLATDPRDIAEHVGRMFLGTQIACARCHAHPSDRWTREDYHRFAAYFARVTRDGGAVKVSAHGEVDHPKTGKALSPKPLGATVASPAGDSVDRRLELAAWTTAPDNPLFARNIVNRVWKHLMGRGLVEPVDDLRPTNPPTHPALLDALSSDFVAGHYDLRRLIRTIVSSRVYQLSSRALEGNRADDRFYSHASPKELPAAAFLDAVAQVTGVPERFEGYPADTRATQLIGSRTPSFALDVLGRCSRERPCEGPARAGGGLAQALHLINGTTINNKLAGGRLAALLARRPADADIIEELYLSALTRPPGAAELAEWKGLLKAAASREEAGQDLLWALLNSREFAFNH
jgi:hypothetical protein